MFAHSHERSGCTSGLRLCSLASYDIRCVAPYGFNTLYSRRLALLALKHNIVRRSRNLSSMHNIALFQELIQLETILNTRIRDVYSHIISEAFGDLLKRKLSCLWPEKVDEKHEDRAPRDDDKVVFPAHVDEAYRSCFEEDDGCGELTEEREALMTLVGPEETKGDLLPCQYHGSRVERSRTRIST